MLPSRAELFTGPGVAFLPFDPRFHPMPHPCGSGQQFRSILVTRFGPTSVKMGDVFQKDALCRRQTPREYLSSLHTRGGHGSSYAAGPASS